VSLGSFGSPLSPSPRKRFRKKTTPKNKGVGHVLFFDTLSITLVVSGPPIGGVVCLCQSAMVHVVDSSCESAVN
jgi:hypothetical protein